MIASVDAAGNRTSPSYDSARRLQIQQDALRNFTIYQFDSAGRTRCVWTLTSSIS